MRPVSLVLMFAACGGGGDGAVLSFTAPEGLGEASRIELVLASADSAAVTTAKQRMRPGLLTEESVVYYRQRSTVDAISGVTTLDGFEVRIEPDQNIVDDETFVPFALIYDAQDALIGVGTVNDGNGIPTPVLVRPGTVASYDIIVVKLVPDTDEDGVAVGQGHAISCEGQQGAWPSGAVWRTQSGPQIRLLLPDVAADPDATDAMERALDLDCDDHAAADRDCDDLRTAYHRGQTETCDGRDTDCDGRPLELIEGCQSSNLGTCGAPNVQICADSAAGLASQCAAPVECACAPGSASLACHRCALSWVPATGGASPCSPSVGKIHFDACPAPGCTVEVVGGEGQWEIKLGPAETGPFTSQLPGVAIGYVYVRATYLGSAPFSITATTIGSMYLAITSPVAGRPPSLIPINLELEDVMFAQCPTTGTSFMRCTP